jgi:hypothetical protein
MNNRINYYTIKIELRNYNTSKFTNMCEVKPDRINQLNSPLDSLLLLWKVETTRGMGRPNIYMIYMYKST